MTRRTALATLGGAAGAISLSAATTAPRPSPEFVLTYLSGKSEKLSQYRGKVCLVEFLFTTCSHCQHTAGVFSKLQSEFSDRGFQAVGIAFNPMSHMLVPDFVRDFKPSFPIAHSERAPVLTYLGISEIERFVVPQVVLIDRAGLIQLQSPPTGDPNLQEEAFLRKEIAKLVAQPYRTSSMPPKAAGTKAVQARTVTNKP